METQLPTDETTAPKKSRRIAKAKPPRAPGPLGEYMLCPKFDLVIDTDYQRDERSRKKVSDIALNLDWQLFGCLAVGLRRSGDFVVIDGGHRLRALQLRTDIENAPCLVFDVSSRKHEAEVFLGANNNQNKVNTYETFRASLFAKEPMAMTMHDIVTTYGYSCSDKSGIFLFNAIAALRYIVRRDEALARESFAFCVENLVDEGCRIDQRLLKVVWMLRHNLKDRVNIFEGRPANALRKAGSEGILTVIHRYRALNVGGGASRDDAKAVLRDVINKGLRNKKWTWEEGGD